jgi:hypothetical protein
MNNFPGVAIKTSDGLSAGLRTFAEIARGSKSLGVSKKTGVRHDSRPTVRCNGGFNLHQGDEQQTLASGLRRTVSASFDVRGVNLLPAS